MPAEITEHLAREIAKVPASPALEERFDCVGTMPVPLDTPVFRKLLADEGTTLSTFTKNEKITVE